MALFDISLPPSIAKALHLPGKSPERQQLKVLKKLLTKARFTEFGQKYHFDEILLSKKQWNEMREAGSAFLRRDAGPLFGATQYAQCVIDAVKTVLN